MATKTKNRNCKSCGHRTHRIIACAKLNCFHMGDEQYHYHCIEDNCENGKCQPIHDPEEALLIGDGNGIRGKRGSA
jgi:hypothetical protein